MTEHFKPALPVLLLAALTLGLASTSLNPLGGGSAAWQALFSEQSLLLHFSWWPRLCMALLAGAGLAMAGVLMQQLLRNPLASPTTLGVSNGANLALLCVSLSAPWLLDWGREWVALTGGALAMGLVMLISWRRALAPLVVALAGLVVNLYLGALAIAVLLFNQEALGGLLIWGAGSLAQNGWDGVAFLAPRLLLGMLLAGLLLRPLALLDLDDISAGSLGISLKYLRLAGLGLAVFLAGCVVSAVGVIGFIGLAAPNIVRLAGARRLGPRLLWSTLLGALLLAATDLMLQALGNRAAMLIPTGAVTAALGAPLLLWLIPRLRLGQRQAPVTPGVLARRTTQPGRRLLLLALALLLACVPALWFGQGPTGWFWLDSSQLAVLDWRLPRVTAALACGLLLALAGTLVQRLSGNPMASPELLGISGGSAIGLMAAVFLLPTPNNLSLMLSGTFGALLVLVLLITLNRRSGWLPERLLLTGVAITALFDALRAVVLAGGDPRGQQLLAWMSGSTYYVDATAAWTLLGTGMLLALVCVPLVRWLDILPLGADTSRALGIRVQQARLLLLLLTAVLTAAATLIIGPLSFVGLLAPHMARLLGFSRAGQHLAGAALVGMLLMVLADWLGRQLLFPNELPAGLMAALIGGAYFMWGLRRL
ncbi:Fe(3+)-hydroxamate ABC transporter permease FhuB [Pseudomonas sp. WN033]|nr:Fe(3+)-hydroxamate ABC transporter permease FhuB [Pseudomonas sp. WN033]